VFGALLSTCLFVCLKESFRVWSSALLSLFFFAGRSLLGFGALALLGGLGFGIPYVLTPHSFKLFKILLQDIIIFV
jgi:hypothetical protein